ncbi:MAG TPA: DUF1223 domain-containing protein [Vicinamibacterales bacterium]
MRSGRRAAGVAIGLACAAATVAGIGASSAVSRLDRQQSSDVPVLVELFTAEGCSSCPPADALLEAMIIKQPAEGVMIVGLGEHVDYWNGLGWRDRFSSAALTARQQVYTRLNKVETYTPQMVVDGASVFIGSDVGAAKHAIETARAVPHGALQIRTEPVSDREIGIAVTASGLPPLDAGDRAEVVAAVTEDHLRSDVKRGENAGKTLTHAAVVRQMVMLGDEPAGQPVRGRLKIDADWDRSQLKIVAFAQARRSRRVLATAAIRMP